MELPELAHGLLAGLPRHGEPEQAIPLLSTDPDGWPHVCLLSRAQLDPRDAGVAAVVTSRQTSTNLVERRRATLLLVAPWEALYLKLDVVEVADEGWARAFALKLVSVKQDAAPMGLTPVLYTPDAALEAYERWDACTALLARV